MGGKRNDSFRVEVPPLADKAADIVDELIDGVTSEDCGAVGVEEAEVVAEDTARDDMGEVVVLPFDSDCREAKVEVEATFEDNVDKETDDSGEETDNSDADNDPVRRGRLPVDDKRLDLDDLSELLRVADDAAIVVALE